jgi:hypothetical protein
LREHLLRGYTLNEKRLRERGFNEVDQATELLSSTLKNQSLVTDQRRAVLDIVQQYTRAWRLLLEYDEDRLPSSPTRPLSKSSELSLTHARAAIQALRESLGRVASYLLYAMRAPEPGGTQLYVTSCPATAASARSALSESGPDASPGTNTAELG